MLKLLSRKIDFSTIENELNFIVSKLVETIQPEKVILFGSAARNELYDCSDIDFILIFENELKFKEQRKKFYKNKIKFSIPIDLIWTTQTVFDLKKDIGGVFFDAHREGKILYAKEHKGTDYSG